MACIYTIEEIIEKSSKEIIEDLESNIRVEISQEQIIAWEEEIKFIKSNLREFNKNHIVIFEYELSEGKRPDVIVITSKTVISLEFKTGPSAIKNIEASLDQAYSYKNRIEKYHLITREHGYKVKSYLVFSHKDATTTNEVLDNDNFKITIKELLNEDPIDKDRLQEWLISSYQAIPSIFDSISSIFKSGKLPEIVKSKSDIKGTMSLIEEYIEKPKNKIQIIFVSGEAGSGKTLLGFSLVNKYKGRARILTGNGPLAKVLQYQIDKATNSKLSGEAYIGHLTSWISKGDEHANKIGYPSWEQDIFIFDEAQRAWNKTHNEAKRKIKNSQPEQIIKLIYKEAIKKDKKITLICLIGDGQEIHSGEQEGILNWSKAIDKINNSKISENFYIAAPEVLVKHFKDKCKIEINNKLYLNDYFRGYEEEKYPKWVNSFLDWDESALKELTKELNKDRYPIYITRSLKNAKKYINENYSRYGTYGICVSSAGKRNLQNYCDEKSKIKNSNFRINEVNKEELGPWFSEECRNLNTYVTEFDCQGLELDFEVFALGGDFQLNNDKWIVNNIIGDFKESEKLTMCKNKHRVLLTRCREGIILWIPDIKNNNELYDKLKYIGVKEI